MRASNRAVSRESDANASLDAASATPAPASSEPATRPTGVPRKADPEPLEAPYDFARLESVVRALCERVEALSAEKAVLVRELESEVARVQQLEQDLERSRSQRAQAAERLDRLISSLDASPRGKGNRKGRSGTAAGSRATPA